jgi:hypothetical protein
MKIEVTYRGTLTVTADYEGETFDPAVEIEKALDATMTELVALPDVIDPCMFGERDQVEVTVTVDRETFPEAIVCADSSIRAAFHAAGVFTHGWDDTDQSVRVEWHKVEADDLIDA